MSFDDESELGAKKNNLIDSVIALVKILPFEKCYGEVIHAGMFYYLFYIALVVKALCFTEAMVF